MYQCLVSNTISVVLLCRCKAGVETQTQSIRLLIFSTAQGSGYENILLDACRTTAAFRITSGWCSGAFGFMLKPQGATHGKHEDLEYKLHASKLHVAKTKEARIHKEQMKELVMDKESFIWTCQMRTMPISRQYPFCRKRTPDKKQPSVLVSWKSIQTGQALKHHSLVLHVCTNSTVTTDDSLPKSKF